MPGQPYSQLTVTLNAVSYTHLDVYKRQAFYHRISLDEYDSSRMPAWRMFA